MGLSKVNCCLILFTVSCVCFLLSSLAAIFIVDPDWFTVEFRLTQVEIQPIKKHENSVFYVRNNIENSMAPKRALERLSKLQVCDENENGAQFDAFRNGVYKILEKFRFFITLKNSTSKIQENKEFYGLECIHKSHFENFSLRLESEIDASSSEFNPKKVRGDVLNSIKMRGILIQGVNKAISSSNESQIQNAQTSINLVSKMLKVDCKNITLECMEKLNKEMIAMGSPEFKITN